MTTTSRPIRWLLTLMIATAALIATAVPAPAARATGNGTPWRAWHINVDFPNQKARVTFTRYTGTDNPLSVDPGTVVDISANCVEKNVQYSTADMYARFDGSTSYIRCNLPALPRAKQPSEVCPADAGPFWVAADVKLDPGQASYPIFDAPDLGIAFGLTRSGATARTQLKLSSGTFRSPNWPVNGSGDRVLMGWNGPDIVAAGATLPQLGFLTDPNWRSYIEANAVGQKFGHWIEAPGQPSIGQTSPAPPSYTLGTQASVLYIGYSPSSAAYFKGQLGEGEVDPGCRGD